MRINLDTGDIEAFTTVASVLNFKAAATRLNISASALSRRIHKLEEQLGVDLLERTTRSVRLTLAGKQFFERSGNILDQCDEAVLALRGGKTQGQATISIGAIPSIAHIVLPDALKLFAKTHPAIRISIRDMTTNDVVRAVNSGEIAFGITSFVQHDPELEFRPLLRGQIVAAMQKDHRLAKKRHLCWSDMEEETLISTWKGAGIRMVIDVELARARSRLLPTFEVQQMYTALRFVEEGMGIAPVPEFFLGSHELAALACRPLHEPRIEVDLGAVISRRLRMGLAAQHLLEVISATCKALPKLSSR